MKNTMIKLAGIAIACSVVSACDSDFKNPVGNKVYSSGDADFSKFVSVGDSLTAGYADGALYLNGQKNSYPAILAQQFARAGGGSFNQPLVSDNLGGLLFGGNPNPEFGNRLILDAIAKSPEPIVGTPTTEVIGSGLNGSMFNNVGVPGAKSFHLGASGYGSAAGLSVGAANPYYVRFSSSSTSSVIVDAAVQQPSFFTIWIGNNDVLSYATNGGDGVVGEGEPPYSEAGNDITDPAVFPTIYDGLVAAMTTANPAAKGVLINIPDVATIPYFTTVPYNPVPLDQVTANLLNDAYAPYNAGVAQILAADPDQVAKRTIVFAPGQNAVVILDETLTDISGVNPPATDGLTNMRQATAEDLLVLTTGSKIGTLADPNNPNSAWGLGVPLVDADVLIPSEIQVIDDARIAFNLTIKAAADADNNLLFFDAAAVMADIQEFGYDYGTGSVTSTYATGGAFSLDGVHPTARGYAIIANEIIDTINTGFSADIPKVDPGSYTTIFIK